MENEITYFLKNTPPTKFDIYERAKQKFGVNFETGVIFTVGQNIHCLFKIPFDYLEHEKTHIRQQVKMGVEKWWDRYFRDNEFRFLQELEAYRAQYQYMKTRENNKAKSFKNLKKYAEDLSGGMYGNLCGFNEALLLIKK